LQHSDSKTIYKMIITKGDSSWDIMRSFSQVCEFHSKMQAILPKLPKLPKKYTLSITKVADLDKR
jgi:hypothetical protein